MTTPIVKSICTGTCHPHDRTTELVRLSLLKVPSKNLVVKPEVEMLMWARGIKR